MNGWVAQEQKVSIKFTSIVELSRPKLLLLYVGKMIASIIIIIIIFVLWDPNALNEFQLTIR